MSSFLCVITSLYLTNSQPALVYDGTSTVRMVGGKTNWTLKYPLGNICEDNTWAKTLTINVTALSAEADLILAFGTQSLYLAVGIAFDGGLAVPYTNGPMRWGAVFVTPAVGSQLQPALNTLEQQYARSNDFRNSLITGTDETAEWEVLVPLNGDTVPMAANTQQLVLEIIADRKLDQTHLTISKNGLNASMTMGSTWPLGNDVFLYFGLDSIHAEIFDLSGIRTEDDCSWKPAPTPGPTTSPTDHTFSPSQFPTLSPTDVTSDPSKMPSFSPTFVPTVNSNAPSKFPSAYPTLSPTLVSLSPSESPLTAAPSEGPTMIPSNSPTRHLEEEVQTTLESIEETFHTNLVNRQLYKESDMSSMISGVDDTYLWIGLVGGLLLFVALGLFIYFVIRQQKMAEMARNIEKGQKEQVELTWGTSIYGD